MAAVALSPIVQKIAKDFALDDGHYRLSEKKMKGWVAELAKLDAKEKPRTVEELIALAIRLEREAGPTAAEGAAQLYACAAGLLTGSTATSPPKRGPSGPASAPPKKKAWGAK